MADLLETRIEVFDLCIGDGTDIGVATNMSSEADLFILAPMFHGDRCVLSRVTGAKLRSQIGSRRICLRFRGMSVRKWSVDGGVCRCEPFDTGLARYITKGPQIGRIYLNCQAG